MAKYEVVLLFEGQMFKYEPKDIFAFGEVGQYGFDGIEDAPRLRAELQGQPKFKKLCGPMWGGMKDGEPVIRYESWEAYDRLSA